MIRPASLIAGDTIGIAATARKISQDELQGCIQLFQSWGLKVRFSPTLFTEENQFGGSDAERIKGLQELINDDEVKAIIIARGGYGTVRIIDQLDLSVFFEKPKWIIGFSDITVLHNHIHRHCGVETIHGPMAFNFMPDRMEQPSAESLRRVLMSVEAVEYAPDAHPMNRTGEAKGQLIGGNLSVLYSLCGSNSDIETDGKILFLEDLDEYLYHIDRMMMNLKRTGKLNKLAGLIVGNMSDMKDNAIPFGKDVLEIIQSHVSEFNYPVCYGFPAGHEKRNLAMRFGAEAELVVGDMVKVSIS